MKTFDEIITDMLARVPDSFDKREGSVIYDALAPAAYELSLAYEDMEEKLQNTYARTANRDGLILRAEEFGLEPFPATYAIRKGVFTPASVEIPIGSRFNFEEINFEVTEKITDGEYKLTCETVGVAGNYGSGTLLPMEYIQGLETASLDEEVLIYGEDEEGTEDFRQRYFDTIKSNARDGNVAQYEKWASEYPGIGSCKVLPLWNGANTVKVSILDTIQRPATEELIGNFQEYLDPGSEGLGNGMAPIGAIVTVGTATAVPVNISATLSLANGYTELGDIEADLTAMFTQLAYKKNTVSYMTVGATILNNPSVERVNNLLINGSISDIELQEEQIAILGETSWTVTLV